MTKQEILVETVKFLEKTTHTQIAGIRANIERVLEARGEAGSITTGNQFMSTTRQVPVSDRDALLTNEVIWDLIAERVLTPGYNRSNLDLPWLHVSDMEKLKQLLKHHSR